ncbi:MAG TPA: fructose PTS transporter subunit IIB, partial [Luteolibacter sp.]|nr:fructose PTS transporter subunit IIB [Luteolibacter sp.]
MKTLQTICLAPPDDPLTRMALAALESEARLRNVPLRILSDAGAADRSTPILYISDEPFEPGGDGSVVSRPVLIRETAKVLDPISPKAGPTVTTVPVVEVAAKRKFIIGVTSCPTGIAHTFMAAEALLKGAAALGYEVKVETRGSVGAKNELTAEDIARADAVVVAADATVETARFSGKRLLETGTKAAINDAKGLIRSALEKEPSVASGSG